jgi:hypothetical protein
MKQKGRSRLWYDDHQWRAYLIEFQPSAWSKGTYCNVGLMWLWDPVVGRPHWTFHIHERLLAQGREFISYERSGGRFEELVRP